MTTGDPAILRALDRGFSTSTPRCYGIRIRAALAAGHAVVATGRDPVKVTAAIGAYDNLLSMKLDVTRPEDALTAVKAAVERFGRIDVLVYNAGNFYAGFFEELSPEQVRNQIETLLFGPMNVTRAVLPTMRKQRSGLLLTISSTAGIAGGMFCRATRRLGSPRPRAKLSQVTYCSRLPDYCRYLGRADHPTCRGRPNVDNAGGGRSYHREGALRYVASCHSGASP